MTVVVEIGFPDGTKQTTSCEGASIVVGTGADADVNVPGVLELAPSHLLLVPRGAGCWISTARGAIVQPVYQSKPFENGMVPFGAELDLGSITVKVLRPATLRRGARAKLLFVAAPLALAIGFLVNENTGLPRTTAEPPSIFEDMAVVCREPARAGAHAQELIFLADSMEIRYAYDPLEGLRAIARYKEAESCAEAVGDRALVAEAQRRHRQLEQKIDGDFRSLRVRLDQARLKQNAAELYTAAHAMRTYLTFRPGAYRDWLAAVERHVSTQMEKRTRVR